MKKLLFLTIRGVLNPRFYIESFFVPWRSIYLLALIAIGILSLSTTLGIQPVVDTLTQDVQSVIDYLPAYTTKDNHLQILPPNKPIYYQSTFFQFAIDDTVGAKGLESNIVLNKEKMDQVDPTIPFSLFIFKDRSYLISDFSPQPMETTSFHDGSITYDQFITLLKQFKSMHWITFIIAFVFNFVRYAVWMLIFALVNGLMNRRLSKPVSFTDRLKLNIIVSFVPLVLLSIIDLAFGTMRLSFFLLGLVTQYIIHLAFRQHTFYLMSLTKVDAVDELPTDDREFFKKLLEELDRLAEEDDDSSEENE